VVNLKFSRHPTGHPHSAQSGEPAHVPDVVRKRYCNGWCAGSIPLIPMERLRHLRLSDNAAVLHLLRIVRAPLLETIMSEYAYSLGNDCRMQGTIYSFPLNSLVLFDTLQDAIRSTPCKILWKWRAPCVILLSFTEIQWSPWKNSTPLRRPSPLKVRIKVWI